MGIDSGGNVWTWGSNGNWDGTPLEQSGLTSVTSISAGVFHCLALKNDGSVWGLGAGWLGQLGNNSYNNDPNFTQLSGIQGAVSIASGYGNSLIAKQDGTISGFGSCNNGELAGGLGIYAVVPKPLFGIAMSETPPTVSITQPVSGATGQENTAIDLQASATASVGTLSRVDYYLNGVKVGSANSGGTWDYSWTPTTSGNLTLEAVAYDSAGVAQVSAPVSIAVAPCTVSAPVLSLASGTYATPQTLTVTSATAGTTIYYTQNGSMPTTSSASIGNGGQINISSTSQYNFVAMSPQGVSPASAATYQIAGSSGDPSAITGFSSSLGANGTIEFTWQPVGNTTSSINIQQENSDGTWTTIAVVDPSQTAISISGLNMSNSTFQAAAQNSFGSSTPVRSMLPPPYATLDLGANMTPIKITNTGYVLMRDNNENYYRFQNGSAVALTVPSGTTLLEATDITEDGTVVGLGISGVADSVLLSWTGTNTEASVTIPSSGNGVASAFVDPLENVWSMQGGDGYYNGLEIGALATNANNPSWFYGDPSGDLPYPIPPYYTGYTVIPEGINQSDYAVCQKNVLSAPGSFNYQNWINDIDNPPVTCTEFYTGSAATTYEIYQDGTDTGNSIPFLPTSFNSQNRAIGPYNGVESYWNGSGTPSPLPSGMVAVSMNAMQDPDGSLAYQIVGGVPAGFGSPTGIQLFNMDPQTEQFDLPMQTLSASAPWSSYSLPAFSFGVSTMTQIINDSGAIVGTATYSGTNSAIAQGSHGMMLVPITITQSNYPTPATADSTTDSGATTSKVIVGAGATDGISLITGAPAMPQLTAQIGGFASSGMTVDWRAAITSERTERGTKDNFDIPFSPGEGGPATSGGAGVVDNQPINTPWNIPDDYPASPQSFFGGNVTVYFTIKNAAGTAITPEQSITFKIRGLNPLDATAKNFITTTLAGGANSDVFQFAWAVVQHESREGNKVYNQFNPSGSSAELPDYGAPDGWGIAQLDTPLGVSADTEQVYNWQLNINTFYQEIDEKIAAQQRFFAAVAAAYPSDPDAQNPPQTTLYGQSMSALAAGAITLYNGVGAPPGGTPCPTTTLGGVTYQNPWTFTHSPARGQPKWQYYPNGYDYLHQVVEEYLGETFQE